MSTVKSLLETSLANARTRLTARTEAYESLVERSQEVLQRLEDLRELRDQASAEVAEIMQALHTLYPGEDWNLPDGEDTEGDEGTGEDTGGDTGEEGDGGLLGAVGDILDDLLSS